MSQDKVLVDILGSIKEGVVVLDNDCKVIYANNAYAEIFGLESIDFIGKNLWELLPKNVGSEAYKKIMEAIETKTFQRFQSLGVYVKKYWETTIFPYFNGVLIATRKISGNEEVAENVLPDSDELRAESSYARNLIEASLDPLVTISVNGKITDVNSATELVTGYSREQLIGQDFSHYFTEPQKAEQGYREVFTKGYVKDYPLAILHRTGKVTDVLYNATVYRDSSGVIQGVFAAARDITERKKMEQQLKDSERLAAIGATAGMVGHDIRNPLQAIMSDTYLLRAELASMVDCKIKQGVFESIDSIEKNIGYINKIVVDLQDYARPLKPECIDVVLYELITDVFAPINIPDGLSHLIEVDPRFSVRSDPTILRRIFTNLIINAIQAMPNGGKLIFRASKCDDTFVVCVEDTGVGIPEEIRPKLFTPMVTTKSKGQGLGLAVVKRLVESLGGSIVFESELGKGTKFIVTLPLV